MEKGKYRVLKDCHEQLYIVYSSDIERCYLSDTHTGCGTRVGGYDAGDYSLDGNEEAVRDALNAGAAVFGLEFLDVEIHGSDGAGDVDFDVPDEMEDRRDEVAEFLRKWERDNAVRNEVWAINYWDGRNLRTKVCFDENMNAELLEVPEDEENEILDAFSKWLVAEEPDGYEFVISRYPTFYVARVESY